MKLLICINQNMQSAATIRFANQIAEKIASGVTLMHVTPDADRAVASKRMNDLSPLLTWPEFATIVRQGNPVREIFSECQTGNYEMIIVGAPTVSGFFDPLFPSVAQTVAENAPVSVLVAKETSRPLDKLLVCSSGTPVSRQMIENAAVITRRLDADAVILHVAEPVPQMYQGLNTMDETAGKLLTSETPTALELNWAAEQLGKDGRPAPVHLRHGLVADEILAETAAAAYDLIILGAPQKQGLWSSLFMGQVAPQVIEKAACAVMVVRS